MRFCVGQRLVDPLGPAGWARPLATGREEADRLRAGAASGCTNAIASPRLTEPGPPASSARRGLAMPRALPRSALWKRGVTPFPAPIAGIAPGANRSRQSLQDWVRVGAKTPGIHLRWLPGATIEFPYRERTMKDCRSRGNCPNFDDFGVLAL